MYYSRERVSEALPVMVTWMWMIDLYDLSVLAPQLYVYVYTFRSHPCPRSASVMQGAC